MTDKYQKLSIPGTFGYTSTLYLHPPSTPPKIIKAFNPECIKTHFPIEKQVYERFSTNNPPSSIPTYYGVYPTLPASLVLEYAENHNLYKYIWDQKHRFNTPTQTPELLYRWAFQAATALTFAHSLSILNSDIHPVNFFLDANLDLKVGDWAGASIDGGRSQSSYRLRHRLFDGDGRDVARAEGISATTEIFALGTALYFMVAGEDVWPELREPDDREEIKRRIRAREFPDTGGLDVLSDVIAKCWRVEFKTMGEVRDSIEIERKGLTSRLDEEDE